MKRNDELSLNIGCGDQNFGDVRVDFRRTKTSTILADSQNLPFREGSFTLVYERNLLEHLPNPGMHLSEVRRVMKSGGVLHLITDAASCLRYYVLRTHTGRYEWEHKGDKHYSIFTPKHLVNHLEATSFKDITWQYVETDTSGRFLDRLFRCFSFTRSMSYSRIEVRARK